MTDLYDQRIDAMKARERRIDWGYNPWAQDAYNATRLAAYKRKRGFVLWVSQGPDAWQVGTDYKHDT